MKQLRRNARRLMKNYKLAKGIIDKADYIVEEDNEMADLIDTLTKEDESALELKFYPIIPNVINVRSKVPAGFCSAAPGAKVATESGRTSSNLARSSALAANTFPAR